MLIEFLTRIMFSIAVIFAAAVLLTSATSPDSGSRTPESGPIIAPTLSPGFMAPMSALKLGSVTPPRQENGSGVKKARRTESPVPDHGPVQSFSDILKRNGIFETQQEDQVSEESVEESEVDEMSLADILEHDFRIKKGSFLMTAIGKLRLGSQIAEGGNGVIFSASLAKAVEQKFAVKFSSNDGTDDIEHEYEILRTLEDVDGPVRAYSLSGKLQRHSELSNGKADALEIRYMVMDLLQEPLADVAESLLLKSIPEKLEFIQRTAMSALSILKGIHSKGIVHGDIHAGAFMFDALSELHIIDFGKARQLKSDAAPAARTLIDESGHWALADRPSLLSEFELQSGREPIYQDDLMRLGEMLYKMYDTFAYSRLFERIIRARLNDAGTCISQIIQFKQTLSADALGLPEPLTALETFYRNVRGMNVDVPVDFDSLIRIFNPVKTPALPQV